MITQAAADILDQLDAARAKATPGPWAQHPADLLYVIGDISDGGESYLDVADTVAGAYPDAALIVAAVNALPKLTAALRTVLQLADQWAALEHWDYKGPEKVARARADSANDAARILREHITAALTSEVVR